MNWLDWVFGIGGFIVGSCFGFLVAAILAAGKHPRPDDPTYWWER